MRQGLFPAPERNPQQFLCISTFAIPRRRNLGRGPKNNLIFSFCSYYYMLCFRCFRAMCPFRDCSGKKASDAIFDKLKKSAKCPVATERDPRKFGCDHLTCLDSLVCATARPASSTMLAITGNHGAEVMPSVERRLSIDGFVRGGFLHVNLFSQRLARIREDWKTPPQTPPRESPRLTRIPEAWRR